MGLPGSARSWYIGFISAAPAGRNIVGVADVPLNRRLIVFRNLSVVDIFFGNALGPKYEQGVIVSRPIFCSC